MSAFFVADILCYKPEEKGFRWSITLDGSIHKERKVDSLESLTDVLSPTILKKILEDIRKVLKRREVYIMEFSKK